jgi:replicative DNA helicase
MTLINIEAEQAVLGAILLDNACYDRIADMLRPDLFGDPLHARLFEAAGRRIAAGNLVSPITMKLDFEGDAGLAQVGGPAYLAQLAGAAMMSAVRDYAGLIVEAAARRGVAKMVADASSMLSEGRSSGEIKSAVHGALQALPDAYGEPSSYTLLRSVAEAADLAVRAYRGQVAFLKTGVGTLDRVLRGLAPGDMCLLAGATSMGKTSLALEIAGNVASAGGGVVFVSLEMTRHDLATRMVSARARVPYADLRDPAGMEEGEFRKWIEATKVVGEIPLRIVPRHVRDIPAIHSAVRRAGLDFKEGRPSLVIVDYAQLIKGPGKGRYEQMTEVSIGLKQLAVLLDVPVLVLCQLSRDIAQREDKRPQLSDIKESGQFENDADQVVFCHRESYWLQRQGPKPDKRGDVTEEAKAEWQADIAAVQNVMELIVRKNRHGRLATAEIGFHDATCRFWELKPQLNGFDGD